MIILLQVGKKRAPLVDQRILDIKIVYRVTHLAAIATRSTKYQKERQLIVAAVRGTSSIQEVKVTVNVMVRA